MKTRNTKHNLKFILIAAMFIVNFSNAKSQELTGIISGEVFDADTKQPIASATISIMKTKLGAISKQKRVFRNQKCTNRKLSNQSKHERI